MKHPLLVSYYEPSFYLFRRSHRNPTALIDETPVRSHRFGVNANPDSDALS